MDSVIDDRLYADIDSEKFVQKAIGFEKDAILYFREFIPFLNPSDRNIVEDLIEEEKGHIRKLADMKKQMAG
jgi:rubrerythrin